ncbi:MAG TPA: MFS transporter [Planctomycetota bacterium]|nr:MFS transporter [Planctomycetota bacterium]HRR80116.1 MFS transporter [Planctomycetota bacterium]HRT95555.1 MFS transporter [Planctomycetota bacterium]
MTSSSRQPLAYALTVNYAGMVCLAVAVNLPPLLLTTLSAALGGPTGLTEEQLGRIGSAIFVGLVVGIVLTGPLADRLGARPFAIAGSLFVGGGLAVLGCARSYAAVLGAAFVMGLGAGVLDMVLSPIVAALQPEGRTSAMNWLHSFYSIGAVATALGVSEALGRGAEWRTISLALIPLCVLVAAGFAGMRVPRLVAEGHDRMRLRRLCRERFFLVALAAIFLVGCTELAMAQWLPAYAEKGLGYSREASGKALMVFCVVMAAGRILGGVVGHRVRALPLMMGACSLAACLYLVASFAPWRPAALAACMAMGLAISCLWPSMLAVAADRFPHGGASMFALLAAFGNGGGILMPWLVGAVAGATSMSWGMATGTIPALLLLALLAWMSRRAA